jgi:lysyl-tRNA synthetase, class II
MGLGSTTVTPVLPTEPAGIATLVRHSSPRLLRARAATSCPAGTDRRAVPYRQRRRVAAGVFAAGAVTLLSAVTPTDPRREHLIAAHLPVSVVGSATALAAVAGIVLLVVSSGLRRGRHTALHATLIALPVASMAHLAKGLDIEEAALCAVVLGWVLLRRPAFSTAARQAHRREPLVLLSTILAASTTAGAILVASADAGVTGDRTLWSVLGTVVTGLLGFAGPLQLTGPHGDTIGDVLVGLGIVTVTAPIWSAIRVRRIGRQSAPDPGLVRRLLADRPDSLGYFALREDRDLITSPSQKAAVSYRVVGCVALAAGDPLGDPEAWPQAINAFLRYADEHGVIPAALGPSDLGATAYARAGLRCLELGDETIVDATRWAWTGRSVRPIRQAVARARRSGVTVDVVRGRDVDDGERATVRGLAARWRHGSVERGFSMASGRLADSCDPDNLLVLARDRTGAVIGILQFVPWGEDGLSLDLMRRSPDAPNGTTELMLAEVLNRSHDLGIARVSLNFVTLRDVLARGARIGAGPLVRAHRRVVLLADRWWQIESLYRFNAKFLPEWNARYLCYPAPGELPRVAVAALRAEAFLPLPTPRLSRSS